VRALVRLRFVFNFSDDADILDAGRSLLSSYKVPIIAITDGPAVAYLFETLSSNTDIKVTRYFLPSLKDALNDFEVSDSSSSNANSLPEATGETFQARVGSFKNLSLLSSESERGLLLNPLGAGDTCSAIFLLEYLDTKVGLEANQ
jgi:hypothetical protein